MKRLSNTEFVAELMDFSSFGPLAQIFIMQAITEYAKTITEDDLSSWPENGIISKESWKAVAQGIYEKMVERQATPKKVQDFKAPEVKKPHWEIYGVERVGDLFLRVAHDAEAEQFTAYWDEYAVQDFPTRAEAEAFVKSLPEGPEA